MAAFVPFFLGKKKNINMCRFLEKKKHGKVWKNTRGGRVSPWRSGNKNFDLKLGTQEKAW